MILAEKSQLCRNMKVTVATLSDTVFTLEVAADMEVENFKALCEVESGIPAAEMVLLFNGQVQHLNSPIASFNTSEMVLLHLEINDRCNTLSFSQWWGTKKVWLRLGWGTETWSC